MVRAIGMILMGSTTGIIGEHFGLPMIVYLAILLFAIGFLMSLDSIINENKG